ncbi:MAG: NAD(P)-dependent glycerol-3-phosphate dehydrogenase [Acidobacteria bacterium]|nr:NAD(P)-dependent glycerol-3-phosphate dehydrogenase [Acidobacteriota bacterium]
MRWSCSAVSFGPRVRSTPRSRPSASARGRVVADASRPRPPRRLSPRIGSLQLPRGAPLGDRGRALGRERERRRHQRPAFRRQGRRPACFRPRRPQGGGRGARRTGIRSGRACGRSRSGCGRRGTHVPCVAGLPRREGRRHRGRGLPAPRAGGHRGRTRRLRPDRRRDALRLPRLRGGHRGPGRRRVPPRCAGARRLDRRSRRRPHRVEASRQPRADLPGDGEPVGRPEAAVKVAVLGGGSWGTALAAHLVRAGNGVRLWAREPEIARRIREACENPRYLPGVVLPAGLGATTDLREAADGAETVLVVVPSEFCRGVYRALRPLVAPGVALVSATKGIEPDSLARMTEVAAAEAPGHRLAVLSGPSFALEVAREQPTAVVVASRDIGLAESLQRALSTRAFRAYSTDDVVGVELAGALKNVVAIAAGIIDGLGHGHNTVAALITRGLAEVTRLAVALGGRADTLAGLAGLGDLVLTCTGALSRNRRLGQALGRGRSLAEAVQETAMVAEGVRTTLAACALAERAGVDMPISLAMKAVLYGGKSPREAVEELMLRSLKRE